MYKDVSVRNELKHLNSSGECSLSECVWYNSFVSYQWLRVVLLTLILKLGHDPYRTIQVFGRADSALWFNLRPEMFGVQMRAEVIRNPVLQKARQEVCECVYSERLHSSVGGLWHECARCVLCHWVRCTRQCCDVDRCLLSVSTQWIFCGNGRKLNTYTHPHANILIAKYSPSFVWEHCGEEVNAPRKLKERERGKR